MAPVPGLGGRALTEGQRKALRQQIAEKKAEQVKADLATRAAKDKANVQAGLGQGAKPRRKKGPEFAPTKVKAGGRTVHTKTRVPTTVVQGAPDNERQRKRAAQRPSRAVAPQLERPKNPNYKPKPKKDQGPPEKKGKVKSSGGYEAPVVRGPHTSDYHPDGREKDKYVRQPAKPTSVKSSPGHQYPANWLELTPAQRGKIIDEGRAAAGFKPKKVPDPKNDAPWNKPRGGAAKSSPGPGPTGTGGGRDADGGKDRTNFEDERRKTNTGGKDRPAVYKPEDDGQRGGYIGRSKKVIPAPGGGIPARKKKTNTGGTSVVKGLTPRF